DKLSIAFKKNILKEKLMDLGPTSKLISEIVKSMETALKSDEDIAKEWIVISEYEVQEKSNFTNLKG
ncbi:hypothetical protein APH17_007000, partial [Campylobacter jejuni]|nr:hypothetical protein [Campylobacter jejuni]